MTIANYKRLLSLESSVLLGYATAILLGMILLAPNILLAETETLSGCSGPTNIVNLSVSKTSSELVDTYNFSLKNNSEYDIYLLAIGEDTHYRLVQSNAQPIQVTSSPANWSGDVGGIHESLYQEIVWIRDKGAPAIGPGQTESQFSVEVKRLPPNAVKMRGMDGKIIEEVDLTSIPFLVNFKKRKCKWGVVELVP